jgi:hypothetical protein
MRRIRIGNDIQVSWEVKTGGESISLEGRQFKLYVRSAYQKQEIKDFVVEGCTISFTYLASMQRSTGARAIILNDATKGSPEKTICADQAFTLVAHTCEENDDDVDFEDFMVSLQSNIVLCSPELKNYIDGGLSDLKDKVEENARNISSIKSEKGAPSGLAPLGEDGKVPDEYLNYPTGDIEKIENNEIDGIWNK